MNSIAKRTEITEGKRVVEKCKYLSIHVAIYLQDELMNSSKTQTFRS